MFYSMFQVIPNVGTKLFHPQKFRFLIWPNNMKWMIWAAVELNPGVTKGTACPRNIVMEIISYFVLFLITVGFPALLDSLDSTVDPNPGPIIFLLIEYEYGIEKSTFLSVKKLVVFLLKSKDFYHIRKRTNKKKLYLTVLHQMYWCLNQSPMIPCFRNLINCWGQFISHK